MAGVEGFVSVGAESLLDGVRSPGLLGNISPSALKFLEQGQITASFGCLMFPRFEAPYARYQCAPCRDSLWMEGRYLDTCGFACLRLIERLWRPSLKYELSNLQDYSPDGLQPARHRKGGVHFTIAAPPTRPLAKATPDEAYGATSESRKHA